MSCRIPASNLEDTLFNAFRKDINKYKHLSAVINDVLKLNIPEEAKMHAIWYYSGFMHSAAFKEERLQTKEWSEGKYLRVQQLIEPMITGKIPFDYSYILTSEKGLQSIFPAPAAPATAAPAVPVSDKKADIEKANKAQKEFASLKANSTKELLRNTIKFLEKTFGWDIEYLHISAEDGGFFTVTLSNGLKFETTHGYGVSILGSSSYMHFTPLTDFVNAKYNAELAALGAAPAAPVEVEDIPPTTQELIASEIADLADVADNYLLDTFKNIVTLIDSNKESITSDMALAYLENALREVNSRKDSTSKVTIGNVINEEIKKRSQGKEEGEMYIPLPKVPGIGIHKEGNIFEFRRANGEKFEASFDLINNYYVYYDPSSPEIHETKIERLPGDQILAIYKKDNGETIDKETLQLRMKLGDILTGMTINGQNMMEELASGLPVDMRFYDAIRIVAGFQTVDFNRKRLERIRTAYPQRTIETSELPVQVQALQEGKGPILTFIKPIEGFTITVTNPQGDKSFEIDPLTNLAFVYPDNTVVPLDIDNNTHVEMLRNMIRIRNDKAFESVTDIYRYTEDITEAQLDELKKSINTYKAFQMEVTRRLESTGDQSNVDIRDIFFKYYDLTNSPNKLEYKGDEEGAPLAQHIKAFEGRLPMVTQKYNESGELMGDPREERIPIVVRKTKNVWEIVDTLTLNAASPINKKIIGESGKTYLTIDSYLKGEFGINVAEYMKNFPTWTAAYLNFKVVKDTLKPVAEPMIPKEMVNSPADMVDFIATMLHAFQNASIEKGNTAMIDLDKNGWGFNVIDGIRAEFVILSQVGDKKTFGIKFTMLPNEKNTDEMVEKFNAYSKNFNIKLNRDTLNELYDNLNKVFDFTSTKITKDMSIEDVSREASTAGFVTPVSFPALNELFETYSKFTDEISNGFSKVINTYDTNVSNGRVSGGLLTDKFMTYGLFSGKSLRVFRRGEKLDQLYSYVMVKTTQNNELNLSRKDTAKRVVLPSTVRMKASRPASKTPSSDISSPVINVDHSEPAIDPGIISEPGPGYIDPNTLSEGNAIDDTAFSIVESLEGFLALSEEDFLSEIETAKEFIPSLFEFVRKNFEDVNVDGHALGYLQGEMIALNDALKAKGVAYHETFHVVFRRLLTPEQQTYYLKKAGETLGDYKTDGKGKYIQVGSRKVYASEFRKQRGYVHLSDSQIKDLIYEEYLADSFQSFMADNKVPRTWMQKLFAYLKKLLNLFKKGGRIDNLFYDITLGRFKTAQVRERTTDVERLYSMDFKGIPYLTMDRNNKLMFGNQVIPSGVVSEVSDKMIYYMASIKTAKPDLRDNVVYNLARERILEEYKIENLIAKNPENKAAIIERYGFQYDSTRWLLGALHEEGETFMYRNYTGNLQYQNNPIVNNKVQTNISRFNATKFMNSIMEEYNSVYKDSIEMDMDELDATLKREDDEQESGQQFADAGFANKAPYEGSAYFRMMFKYIPYEYYDSKVGITRTRMIDSKLIFSTIRKITANLQKEEIVPRIVAEIQRLESDIFQYNDELQSQIEQNGIRTPDDITDMIDLRDSLKAVYNVLVDSVGMNPLGYATKNKHILVMFQDVFNTVDARLMQVQLKTKQEWDAENKRFVATEQKYLVSDIVVQGDINKIRNDLRERVTNMRFGMDEIKPSLDVLDEITVTYRNEKNLKQEFMTEDGMFNDAKFRSFINKVYVAVSKFNLNIPYSVIYTSLGLQAFVGLGGNVNMFHSDSELRMILRANQSLIKEIKNLNYDFWSSKLKMLMSKSAVRTDKERQKQIERGITDDDLKRFLTAYVDSMGEFIMKYNPRISGSVTRDANGNLVNKYVKATPAYVVMMKLQSMFDSVTGKIDIQEGLNKLINEDYMGMTEYFRDNPILNTDIQDIHSTPVLKFFLENLSVGAFAGFSQNFNIFQQFKEGETSTFKTIDDKAYMLSMFGLFSKMTETVIPGTKEKLTTFKRILTQYEATSTSIVVDGLFTNYYDEKGNPVSRNNVKLVTDHVMKMMRQEYNLMLKNFKELNEEGVRRYKGYNTSEKDENGNSLRGFTFNVLSDMFGVNVDPTRIDSALGQRIDLREDLIDLARNNTPFDAILSNPSSKTAIVKAIDSYVNEQYQRFETYLSEIGVQDVDLPLTASPEQFKKNFFANTWVNGMFVNQLFDGPIAVGVKDFANFFKRQKSGAASGSNIYDPSRAEYGNTKTYRSAVIKEIVMYLDNADLSKPMQPTPFLDEDGKPLKSNRKISPFDGQSIHTMDRRMRIADSLGLLDYDSMQIMKRMRFETRSTKEYREGVEKLREAGIVFNSVKSLTAAPMVTIKQSEHTLIRKEVSMLRQGLNYETSMKELEDLYAQADYYAMLIESGAGNEPLTYDPEMSDYDFMKLTSGQPQEEDMTKSLVESYMGIMQQIHSYYRPAVKGPLGGFLHNMLNSMELHRIEQVYDPTSSKKSTVAPLNFDMAQDARPGAYLDLESAVENVPNDLTYLQVETSKITNKVTSGIQQKLLLISQMSKDDPRYKEIRKDLEAYQEGLADFVKSQTERMKRMFNTNDKNIIKKLYANISAGLKEQGADASILQYFELDTTKNQPINPPDMPRLERIMVYYFFSMFNKNIYDKKIEGRKYYHVSPILFPVMEMDGQIVKRMDYKRDPKKYEKATSRYLNMSVEEVVDPKTKEKVKKYTFEVIVPRELEKVDQAFLEKYLSEFFATRIPTEDRRSMFVAKVVDYMDEAYGSNIAAPFQIHLLAGSDFDIDTLYAYIKASYYALDGTRIPYGEYSHYIEKYGMSVPEAKFIEYLTSMSNDELLEDKVNEEVRKIKNQTGYMKESAIAFGEYFEGGKMQEYFNENADILDQPETKQNKKILIPFQRLIATANILRELEASSLPASPGQLVQYITQTKTNPVPEIILNDTLDAKVRILSNEKVFDRFFADTGMRADAVVDDYKNAVERRGLSEKEIYNKQNLYTPTALAVARSLNSESKDSLGIAASFNKGVSMLATINAEMASNITNSFYQEIVQANPKTGKTSTKIQKVTTDRIVDDAVQLVGSLIGIYADAANNPYPGPLNMNRTTTPVLASMLASGVPKMAAIMFQSLPVIKDIITEYNQTYGSAYSSTQRRFRVSLQKFITKRLDSIKKELNSELINRGLMSDGTLVSNSYKIIYNDDIKPDTQEQISTNTVPIDNFGYRIEDSKGLPVSMEIENLILLNEFNKYLQFGNEISFGITKLTDPLKALRPDFDRFDSLVNDYTKAKAGKLKFFTKATMEKLFETYPVLDENMKSITYMSDVSRMIMMERTSFMKGLVSLFNTEYGYDVMDIRKDLKSFLAMQIQRSALEEKKDSVAAQIYLEQLDPKNFLGGQVISDYYSLLKAYPNNEFLLAIKTVNIGPPRSGMKVLEIATSKLGSSGKEKAFTDLMFLLESPNVDEKIKAFRIAYHGMIKAGGNMTVGGYYDLLPSFLSRPMAEGIWKLQKRLVDLDKLILSKHKEIDNQDGTYSLPEAAETEYQNAIDSIFSDTFGGMKLDDLITESISKIVSMRLNDESVEEKTSLIRRDKFENISDEQFVQFFETVTPDNHQFIIAKREFKDKLKDETKITISRPQIRGGVAATAKANSYDLYTPDVTGKLTITIPDITDETADDVRMLLRAADIQGNFKDGFKFPLYKTNIYGQIMVLKKIDGQGIGKTFINTLLETEMGIGSNALELRGKSAEYETVVKQGTSKISPFAFNNQQGAEIHNMINTKPQSTTIMREIKLPDSVNVVPQINKAYQMSESETPSSTIAGRTLTRMDGSKITTQEQFYRYAYDPRTQRIIHYNPLDETYDEVLFKDQPQRFDNFAKVMFNIPTWDTLKNDSRFEDFMKGESYIFVYDLVNSVYNPLENRPDGITIKDMDDQIEQEENKCKNV